MAGQPHPGQATRSPRVLLVDDNTSMRRVLRGLLEDAGIQVVGEATDGLEGVAQAGRPHWQSPLAIRSLSRSRPRSHWSDDEPNPTCGDAPEHHQPDKPSPALLLIAGTRPDRIDPVAPN
jgi:CheY-like chemotaxis protein